MMNLNRAFERLSFTARAILYKEFGEFKSCTELADNVHVATLPEFLEIARNAGFTVVGPNGKQYN